MSFEKKTKQKQQQQKPQWKYLNEYSGILGYLLVLK